jgi:hypothetical protein
MNHHAADMLQRFVKGLPPETKVSIIKAMGFSPTCDPHTAECPSLYGNRCNCVPYPTFYTAPDDVIEWAGETWAERLAKRKAEKQEGEVR